MSRCVFSPRAEADLEEIGDYIAQDNPQRALSFVRELCVRCDLLAGMPYSGTPRTDIAPNLRSRAAGNYVIYYQPVGDGIEVVRVLHGRRHVPRQFEQ